MNRLTIHSNSSHSTSNSSLTYARAASNNGNNQQSSIVLVEKILEQISKHFPCSNNKSNNNQSNVNGDGGLSINRNNRFNNRFKQKNYYKKTRNVNTVDDVDQNRINQSSNGYCHRCQYQFINNQIECKKKCQHCLQQSNNQDVDEHVDSIDQINKHQDPIIIEPNAMVKKYESVEIVFDKNMIGVIPLVDQNDDDGDGDKNNSITIVDDDDDDVQIEEFDDLVEMSFPSEQQKLFTFITPVVEQQQISDDDNDHSMIQMIYNPMANNNEIGFNKLDGNNSYLYCYIGDVNQNAKQFRRPSEQLLQYLLDDNNFNINDYFNTNIDDKCYDHTVFYQILDRLCYNNQDLNQSSINPIIINIIQKTIRNFQSFTTK